MTDCVIMKQGAALRELGTLSLAAMCTTQAHFPPDAGTSGNVTG